MIAKLIVVLALAGYAYGQTCLAITGGCIMGGCPSGNTCIQNICCVTDASMNCNNTQSEQFCEANAAKCTDATLGTQLQKVCPRTCKACTTSTTTTTAAPGTITTVAPSSTTCADKVNPTTGVSDCPQNANLCTNPAYKTLMQEQCPKTCGYCTSSSSGTPSSTTCVDKVNPATGVSDCSQDYYLCTNPAYKTLMQQQCPKTCGYC